MHRLIECHCPPIQTIHDLALNQLRSHLLNMIHREDNLVPNEQREQLIHAAREFFIRSPLGQEQKSLPEMIRHGLLSSKTINEIQTFFEQLIVTYDSLLSQNRSLKKALEDIKALSFRSRDNHPDATLLRELTAEITTVLIDGELGRTRVENRTISLMKFAEDQIGDFNAPDFANRLDRFMNRYLTNLHLPELDSLRELLNNMQFNELKVAARELFFQGPHHLREISVDVSWIVKNLLTQRENSANFEQSLRTIIQDNLLSTHESIQLLMQKLDAYINAKGHYRQIMEDIKADIIAYIPLSPALAEATVSQPSTLAKLALSILDSF